MEQKKNELGRIYGARISKNGNWLNLIIRVGDGENLLFVTCPVRIEEAIEQATEPKKPFALISENERCAIYNIPLYEKKEPEKPKEPKADDLPF